MPEKKGTQGTGREGKHSWNGCGSENSGGQKAERKRRKAVEWKAQRSQKAKARKQG